jgi:hypothetical protein
VEDDAQVLEELRPHNVLGLARENRSSFGKFEQDFSGRRSPRTPTSFDNDGRERETILHAKALGGEVTAFKILILLDSRAGVTYGSRDVPETWGDGEVKCKRSAAAPPRQIDVCRTAGVRRGWSDPILWERTHERAWLEESRFFQFWVQTCSGGKMEDEIAEEVVTLGTVTAARTHKAMVAELVQDTFT